MYRLQRSAATLETLPTQTADLDVEVESSRPFGEGSQEESVLLSQQEETGSCYSEVESARLSEGEYREQPDSAESENSLDDSLPQGEVALPLRSFCNINYVLEQLHEKFDEHDPLQVCNFRDLIQTKYRRYGLQTQIFLRCRVCNFEDSIWTDRKDGEAMDINRSAVAGCYATGIGFSQFEELTASMGIPCMWYETYHKIDLEIIAAFEKAALTEMLQAGEIAKNLALERGDFIMHNGMKIPFVTVVADCGWMKRSYKTGKYDSLSGVAAIVEQHTQKVIFIGVRNKYCCICEVAARRQVTPREHACFKNWGRDQASTAMESDAILEGFKSSMETHGLIYRTLVADGDSSVYKSILDHYPYAEYEIVVEKKECVNHLYRNLAKKIRNIASTKGSVSRLKRLVGDSVLKSRQTVEMSVAHRQIDVDEGSTTFDKVELLTNDILNVPYHVFGDHRKCSTSCQEVTTNEGLTVISELKNAALFQPLEEAFMYLSRHADSLLYGATNNVAESFNAIVCKLTGGKRINWGLMGSFQGRSYGAVLQHNTQSLVSKVHVSEGKEPPSTTTALETRRQRKVRRTAEHKKTRRASRSLSDHRHNKRRGPDNNYGPNAEQPDMPDDAYHRKLKKIQERWVELQQDRVNIEINTRRQASSPLWKSLRKVTLTASNFGRVCRMRDTTSCASTVKSILYPSQQVTAAMAYGSASEPDAIIALQNTLAEEMGHPVTIRPCGLFIDPQLGFLGATPDGIIDDTTIVEVKSPYSARNHDPEEAIRQGVTEIPKFFDKNDPSKMNTSHQYYYQVQGQLHITGAETCYFSVWSRLGLKYVKVPRDDAFWRDHMEPQLTRFYKECMLPELVDGRHKRNMPIREADYIVEARRLKTLNVGKSKAKRPIQRSKATVAVDGTPGTNDDGGSLSQTQNSGSECEGANSETSGVMNVAPTRLRRDSTDSWSVTSSEEDLRVPYQKPRIASVKIMRHGDSWATSSSDEGVGRSKSKPRLPPLKLRKVSSGHYRIISSLDEQGSPLCQSQGTPGTVLITPTLQLAAPTKSVLKPPKEMPWVVIADDDGPTSCPTEEAANILKSVNKTVEIDVVKKDILSQNSLLNDTSIDQFLSVIKETTQFNTETSLWLGYWRFIKPSETSQDIHILGGNAFRHWRCFVFDGAKLCVYDSLGCNGYQKLEDEVKRFITLRYPNLDIKNIVFPVVQRQPDGYSCGVYAAAFATTVVLGGNPSRETYSKDVMKLRNHLFRIIENKQLSAFPSV